MGKRLNDAEMLHVSRAINSCKTPDQMYCVQKWVHRIASDFNQRCELLKQVANQNIFLGLW